MVARQLLSEKGTSGKSPEAAEPCLVLYEQAKRFVIAYGYGSEVNWQAARGRVDFTETDLLREAAWVILCSGFRESIIRSKFDYISLCFSDWVSAAEIVRNESNCVATAYRAFRNGRKLHGIVGVARHLVNVGFEIFKAKALGTPVACLAGLPWIGPVTACHLAKNLGFDVAKNDRHLQRLSAILGFPDAQELCKAIADRTGDRIAAVDIVLWRFMSLGGRIAQVT